MREYIKSIVQVKWIERFDGNNGNDDNKDSNGDESGDYLMRIPVATI